MDGRKHGSVHGWMDGWMDRREWVGCEGRITDEWMDGWMFGWVDCGLTILGVKGEGVIKDQLKYGICVDRVHSEPK